MQSGPFLLAEWRPYEKVVVRRNPGYWEAGLTGLDEIVFLPITDSLGVELAVGKLDSAQ